MIDRTLTTEQARAAIWPRVAANDAQLEHFRHLLSTKPYCPKCGLKTTWKMRDQWGMCGRCKKAWYDQDENLSGNVRPVLSGNQHGGASGEAREAGGVRSPMRSSAHTYITWQRDTNADLNPGKYPGGGEG